MTNAARASESLEELHAFFQVPPAPKSAQEELHLVVFLLLIPSQLQVIRLALVLTAEEVAQDLAQMQLALQNFLPFQSVNNATNRLEVLGRFLLLAQGF
jgi:hypothetical protein